MTEERCFECKGCKLFQQEWAAFGAAISEASDPEAIEASWNAYRKVHAEALKCTGKTAKKFV